MGRQPELEEKEKQAQGRGGLSPRCHVSVKNAKEFKNPDLEEGLPNC